MANGLSKYESETVINFNSAEKIAYVSTSQKWMKDRLKKLAQEHPEAVKIVSEDKWTLMCQVDKKYVKNPIRPPRFVSEEQRAKAAERLKEYRKNKNISKEEIESIESELEEMDDSLD